MEDVNEAVAHIAAHSTGHSEAIVTQDAEAEAIFTAAELEGASAVMYSFTMTGDGSLFSGMEAGPVLRELEQAGADHIADTVEELTTLLLK